MNLIENKLKAFLSCAYIISILLYLNWEETSLDLSGPRFHENKQTWFTSFTRVFICDFFDGYSSAYFLPELYPNARVSSSGEIGIFASD